ncbi:MAG: FHA domain-containing protein, partial [Actinomycetales bacterium]|nr:FHA domain-containing protein [Actinomycetales bacterium]
PELGDHDGETVVRQPFEVVAPAPVETPRGAVGRVRLSTGQEIDLDRPVVVGRKPRVSRVGGTAVPRLVSVPSPEQDISRSHLEVRLEGVSVLVVDLGSTNGSTLLRTGQLPVRLHPHEAVLVVDGDVVDLGEGITLTFEGLA